MGLPGSRGIEVRGVKLRWLLRDHDELWSCYLAVPLSNARHRVLMLVVQSATGRGPKLIADIRYYRPAAVEAYLKRGDIAWSSETTTGTMYSYAPPSKETCEVTRVTPALIRAVIEQALDAGWKPESRGRGTADFLVRMDTTSPLVDALEAAGAT